MNGKGDTQRPRQCSRGVLECRWQLAFGNLTPKAREAIMEALEILEEAVGN